MTIVPHGPLYRVSFAALQDANGAYLLESYDLGYGPSASAFAWTDRVSARSRSQSAGRALVVADPRPLPFEPGQTPLPRLSAANVEAAAIRRSVGREQTTVLSGLQAQEPAVRDAIGDRRVVHFATHAVIQDDAPLESYLALGGSGDSSAVDGRLTVRELYDLSLSADLVVLSACRTATGRPSGDGIAGMARALFYAGTPSVVATLWDVADQPSATLISGFYAHWMRGGDKRAALRRAQLDLLRQLRSGSMLAQTPLGNVRLDARPFYWAGYVLIGEPF
jgi:CHAT domain-containing protein